jgi:hypothetical protein
MANQAIALQARAPQSNPLGGAIQQGAQMINMMSQQRAAERQNAIAQQQMEIARAGEARAAAKEGRDIGEFKLKQIKEVAAYFRDSLASWARPGDVASTQALRDDVIRMVPAWDKIIPSAEVLANDPKARQLATMKADEILNFSFAKPEASFQLGEDGRGFGVTVGGLFGPSAQEVIVQPPAGGAAPAQAPTPMPAPATGGVQARPTQGAATAPSDLMQQGVDPRSIPMGNPLRPASMTTGPQMGGQPDLAAVVQDMMSSGQISQANLQLMRDTAGPANDAQLAEILKANNIQIVPDAEPSMRSAVFRPGEDAAPQMQQVQSINRPGTQFRGKDPMQSPLPGSAQVPITRVRQQAQAERESPQEAAAKAAAVARANAAAEAEAKQTEKLPGRRNVSTIIGKMRSAYEKLDELEAITSEKRGGLANFFDYLGSTTGGREIQKMYGSEASKYFTQIATLRKQLATAIKNATGMSAQEMNSNVELQLTLDSLSDPTQGIEAALTTMSDLEELYGLSKPAAGKSKTPTGQRKSLGQILGGR